MIMGESGAGKGDGFSQNTSTQEAPLSAIAVVKVKFALERVFSSSKGMEIVRNLAECAEKERINLSLKLIHLTIDELLPELSNSLLRVSDFLWYVIYWLVILFFLLSRLNRSLTTVFLTRIRLVKSGCSN